MCSPIVVAVRKVVRDGGLTRRRHVIGIRICGASGLGWEGSKYLCTRGLMERSRLVLLVDRETLRHQRPHAQHQPERRPNMPSKFDAGKRQVFTGCRHPRTS